MGKHFAGARGQRKHARLVCSVDNIPAVGVTGPDRTRQVLSNRVVLVLSATPLLPRLLLRALGTSYMHVTVDSWGELERTFPRMPATSLVVVDPYVPNRPRGGLAEGLRDFLRQFPSATVVALVAAGPESVADMRRLGEWGVSQILAEGFDTHPFVLRQRLEEARLQSLRYAISESVPSGVPVATQMILDRALEVTLEGGTVPELARRLHVSHRTLVRRCRRRGIPAPKTLLRWMRLLLAASMLDDPARTVSDVALSSGYTSDTSLRRALRLSGLPNPVALRKGDAFQAVMQQLLQTIAPKASR